MPLNVRCRHTIGLNHVAIGIEMQQQTGPGAHWADQQILHRPRQVRAALRLVRWLQARYHIATAERLLSQVRYQAAVTLDEYVPTKRDNIGNLVVNAFSLIGILLAFALVSGLAVGGFRAFRRRGAKGEEADAILALHLDRTGGKP